MENSSDKSSFSLSVRDRRGVGWRARRGRKGKVDWMVPRVGAVWAEREGGGGGGLGALRRRSGGGGAREGGWLAGRGIGATRQHGGRRRLRAELHPEAAAQAGGRRKSADLRVPADQLAEARDIVVSGRGRAWPRHEDQLPDAERRDEQVPRRPRARRRDRDRRRPVQGEGQEQDGRGRGFDQPEFQS